MHENHWFTFFIYCVCIHMCTCVHATTHMWRSKDNWGVGFCLLLCLFQKQNLMHQSWFQVALPHGPSGWLHKNHFYSVFIYQEFILNILSMGWVRKQCWRSNKYPLLSYLWQVIVKCGKGKDGNSSNIFGKRNVTVQRSKSTGTMQMLCKMSVHKTARFCRRHILLLK